MELLVPDLTYRVTANPLSALIPGLADVQLMAVDKYFIENSRVLRGFIQGLIDERKNTTPGSRGSDIVSLLLEDECY